MATRVVHLKMRGGVEVVTCDVYIGRQMTQGGWRLKCSKWANPFKLAGNNRQQILRQYRDHVLGSPDLMQGLHELRGKVLGCWCVEPRCVECGIARDAKGGLSCGHLQCHGDVLIELLTQDDVPSPVCAPIPKISDDDPIWSELGL
jgi:Domain of unknown function (DUF4326)